MSILGYPGNPLASRLPATQVTTSAYMVLHNTEKIERERELTLIYFNKEPSIWLYHREVVDSI
jgi:hypothetical protein